MLLLLPKLQFAVAGVIAASIVDIINVAKAFQLKDAANYEVKRDLLGQSYPAFDTFGGEMHAGLMPAANIEDESVGDDYSSYFFWLFQPDGEASGNDGDGEEESVETFRNDTLLIWLNGGPGCSSMVGMLGEMGPVGVPKFGPGIPAPNPATIMDAPLVENPYAWTKKTAMIFVEQPGGTGFSTASSEWTGEEAEKRTEDDVAAAFWDFLQNLYTVFGEDLSSKKLYLVGESYAGVYIPSITRGIHLRNKKILANEEGYRSSSLHAVNLRGMAIGNGWIDAKIQGPTIIDHAWWHGVIDLQTYRGLHEKWDECVAGKIVDSSEEPYHPFNMIDECGIASAVMEASGSTFPYDVTTYDAYPGVLKEDGTVSRFLNDPIVRDSLNAPSIADHTKWLGCVPGSGRRRRLLESKSASQSRELILLQNDKPLSVVPYIAELLDDAHLDVLLYNGDLDLSCNSQGTELSLESMDWSGKQEWLDPDTTIWHQWNVDGQPAGHTKAFNNLEFVVVYNSGHFVPINQARNSLNMIGRLLEGKSFGDKKLKTFPPQHVKGLEGTLSSLGDTASTEETQTAEKTHSFSLLIGLCGFLLGLLASHFYSNASSSSIPSSPFPATETTSLRHAERDNVAA